MQDDEQSPALPGLPGRLLQMPLEGGKADVAGFLEFSSGYFFTQGNAVTDAVDFEGWRATKEERPEVARR